MSTSKTQEKAFRYEQLRDTFATKSNLANKKYVYKYYKNILPEINGSNLGIFWDKELLKQSYKSKINYVEEHRISLISEECIGISRKKSIKLLDVGIGNGLIEDRLQLNKNIELFGVDISKYALNKANSKFKGIFKLSSITNIPFGDSMFDIAVASEVLEHVPPSTTFQALSEIKRVLKPNGYLLLSIPVNENLEEMITQKGINPNQHARAYTKNIIGMELKLGGFVIYKIHELYAFSNLYHLKTIFIKSVRLFNIKILPNTQINNLVIFAQKL